MEPNDSFSRYLKSTNQNFTEAQKSLSLNSFFDSDSLLQPNAARNLAKRWTAVAEKIMVLGLSVINQETINEIQNNDTNLNEQAKKFIARLCSKPEVTAYKFARAVFNAELESWADEFCKKLAQHSGESSKKTFEAHPVQTSSPDAVATQVIFQQMEQMQKMKEENARLRAGLAEAADSGLCVVCKDVKADQLVRPCGQISCCEVCIKAIRAANQSCPTCRGPIQSVEKVYIS